MSIADAAKAMAVSIVGGRLDYCNSILYGMLQANNVLAWVVEEAPSSSSCRGAEADYGLLAL